jgi:hypothetical protein
MVSTLPCFAPFGCCFHPKGFFVETGMAGHNEKNHPKRRERMMEIRERGIPEIPPAIREPEITSPHQPEIVSPKGPDHPRDPGPIRTGETAR